MVPYRLEKGSLRNYKDGNIRREEGRDAKSTKFLLGSTIPRHEYTRLTPDLTNRNRPPYSSEGEH